MNNSIVQQISSNNEHVVVSVTPVWRCVSLTNTGVMSLALSVNHTRPQC